MSKTITGRLILMNQVIVMPRPTMGGIVHHTEGWYGMSLFLTQQIYVDTPVESFLAKVQVLQQLWFWWVRPSTAISSASSISILVLHNCPFLALICGITRPYNTLPISKLGNGNLTILEREMQLVTFPSSLI